LLFAASSKCVAALTEMEMKRKDINWKSEKIQKCACAQSTVKSVGAVKIGRKMYVKIGQNETVAGSSVKALSSLIS